MTILRRYCYQKCHFTRQPEIMVYSRSSQTAENTERCLQSKRCRSTESNKIFRGIKLTKSEYARKNDSHFSCTRDTRCMWQGIQTITDFRSPPRVCETNTFLPDTLNSFYARFEVQNNKPAGKIAPPPNGQTLCLSEASLKNTLVRVNPQKAAGSDNVLQPALNN